MNASATSANSGGTTDPLHARAVVVQADAEHNRRDDLHATALAVMRALAPGTSLVTTLPVLLESLTLVRRHVHHRRAADLGQAVLQSDRYEVVYPGAQATAQALQMFEHYADVPLSFTDGTSFVVMRACGLTQAFAFDGHFRMFGFHLCR